MLQKCKRHGTNLVQGYCLKCNSEGSQPFTKLYKLNLFINRMPQYRNSGSYPLAYKVYQIFMQALERKLKQKK